MARKGRSHLPTTHARTHAPKPDSSAHHHHHHHHRSSGVFGGGGFFWWLVHHRRRPCSTQSQQGGNGEEEEEEKSNLESAARGGVSVVRSTAAEGDWKWVLHLPLPPLATTVIMGREESSSSSTTYLLPNNEPKPAREIGEAQLLNIDEMEEGGEEDLVSTYWKSCR